MSPSTALTPKGPRVVTSSSWTELWVRVRVSKGEGYG